MPEATFIETAILIYSILYYTILYYTILYYTILYYTILYYTIKAQLLALFPLQISKTNETSYEPTL